MFCLRNHVEVKSEEEVNMKLSSHGFLFHRNINRRENKVQISLITHHNEKKQRMYF